MLNLVGQRYGRLVVESFDRVKRNPSGHTEVFWKCVCDCGSSITVRTHGLRSGNTSSCGCLRSEKTIAKNTTHNQSNTKLYRVWSSIKDRCFNQKCSGYKNYGGRGITMCEEWKNSFESFYLWATNNGYKNGLTIERVDNDGDYSPENCTFIPKRQQPKNRRSCHYITYLGKTKTLSEWCREYKIDRECLRNKGKRLGSDEKALEEFLKRRGVVA